MSRVILFGTFDGLHKGHRSFINQARKLGDYLIIVVARDSHVEKAKNRKPRLSQEGRLKELRRAKIANKILLGSKTHNFYRTIRTYKPDIIVLGYDQKPTIWDLKRDLRRHRIKEIKIIRLRSYKPDIFKSSKLNQ